MRFGPVGIRCPEHASATGGAPAPRRAARRASFSLTRRGPVVTQALIAVNVGIFLLQLAMGGNANGTGTWIYENGVLFGPVVADGEWWRLLTAAFLHYGLVHLGMNMLVLWILGQGVEEYFGHARYALLYFVSGLAGSAGALLLTPDAVTVGASGAIYGVFGAILVLERQGTYVFGGSVIPLLVINFAFTLFIPGISKGGHIGGFVGGALAILVLSRFGQKKVVYAREDLLGYAGLVAIGIVSVALAYWTVRGYA